ncbi:hypothetical protein C5S53_09150 [Methanophagales archaeon]|nr:hypothetical protein C5S53_09150 [Methanophagales archaeon]
MKRREIVLGISLACIFIVAIVVQVTFGGGGVDLSIQPSRPNVDVGSTCTYNITLFTFERNWFKITILPDTCDPSWFEWRDSEQIELKDGETKQISLNVTPSKTGEYNFRVRASTWVYGETSSEIGARIRATGLTCIGLQPNLPSPQKNLCGQRAIIWTAYAYDPDAGEIEYRFKLNGPRTDYSTETVKGWSRSNEWVWIADTRDVGNSMIHVEVRTRHHDYTDTCEYVDYEISLMQLPCCTCLMPDKSEPQVGGTTITWTACAGYPDQEQLSYRFWVDDSGREIGRDWARSNSWTWTPSNTGDYDVKVEVRDVRDSKETIGNATYGEYSIISTKASGFLC